MEGQYNEIRPLYEVMEEKITVSDFYDIIENKGQIWMINDTFTKENAEFYELMGNAQDSDLVFDKIECKKNLENYMKQNLILKIHTIEVLEVLDKGVIYHQPFNGNKRKVNIDDKKLPLNPTLLNAKELSRLMIIGGNKGYRASNKVFYVDECMNSLILHSRLNVGRVGHAALLINNKDVYVVGGYNNDKNEWLASVEACQNAFESES